MNTLLILFVAGITLTIGDLVAGKWIQNKNKFLYVLTLCLYLIGLNFLIYSYKFEDIAVASITMEIFNVVTLTLAGRFLFKENITKTEFAGIIVGIIAVVILEIS
jgi:multidrug transporter EmrE-like cation transporter